MVFDVPEIHAAEKTALPFHPWRELENRKLMIVSALEIDGVTIEGLALRGSAIKNLPNEAVTFQLECVHDPARRDLPIDRVDWRPLNPHNNRGKGPEEWQFVEISGSHHHKFGLNWLPDETRMLQRNLPIAIPLVPDPASFEDLIEFVRDCFRINSLEIPIPPWEANLL